MRKRYIIMNEFNEVIAIIDGRHAITGKKFKVVKEHGKGGKFHRHDNGVLEYLLPDHGAKIISEST